MRACILLGVLALSFVPLTARCDTRALSREKAEMMGRVEDFFLHNFRDITWRKSLEWGAVESLDDGARTIRYTYEAKIWDKEHLVMSQEFTFAEDGECLRYENVAGFPQKKLRKMVDVSTREGMMFRLDDHLDRLDASQGYSLPPRASLPAPSPTSAKPDFNAAAQPNAAQQQTTGDDRSATADFNRERARYLDSLNARDTDATPERDPGQQHER